MLTLKILQTFSEHLACLGRLYKCQERNKATCPNTQRCLQVEPVVAEIEEEDSLRKIF